MQISNTVFIKKCIEAFMEDGQIRSKESIDEYVFNEAKKAQLEITPGMIAGVVKRASSGSKIYLEKVERGHYKYINSNSTDQTETESTKNYIYDILRKTLAELDSVFSSLSFSTLIEEDIETIKKTKIVVQNIKNEFPDL